jgi:hypothetical protein
LLVNRILSLLCSLLFSGSVLLVAFTMQLLAEAANDGWDLQNSSGITEFALSIAPFGIYPLVTATLVGFAYLSSTWNRPIGIDVVLASSILCAMSLAGAAVSAHVAREQIYLDGGRHGTLAGWFLHTGVAIFLAWFGAQALKRRRAQSGPGE